ncbi:MAG: EAL domain-containing protein [Candidatus Thiodiazotropha sp.]
MQCHNYNILDEAGGKGTLLDSGRSIHVGGKFTLELVELPDVGVVVIKFPTAAIPSPSVLARLDHEYAIGRLLHHPNVRDVVGRTTWKQRPAIKLRYVAGETFKSYFQVPAHRYLENILSLALCAATTMDAMHTAGVIHRDIAASNLLVADNGERAVFIDFGLATHGGHHNADHVAAIEGQLPYLSPEQTGRIELPVDARSDLYSFGVVLYEMLTGELPFQAEDAAGWIHAHLARVTDAPHWRVPELPQAVSDIVMRLLAKIPDDRYQTARGLCHDLAHCLDDLRRTGDVLPFPLGRGDHSGRLRFPQHLYGREQEREILHSALAHAIAGEPGLLLVAGFAGAGKTALVSELRFPTAAASGRFISGKFDQTLRAIPYAAFAEAFAHFCYQLLGGTPAELAQFRRRVLESLGSNAGLMIEFVPALEAVIGPQPMPPPLPTMESANRFAVTLLGFFHCLVAAERPLVLFLDDLQWADAASLDLVHTIMTRTVSRHFLVVGAYRPGQLPDDRFLPNLVESLQGYGRQVEQLSLIGLTLPQTETMLADVLEIGLQKATSLAAMIHGKTDGNPFFIRQLLETLVKEGALYFDAESENWHWDDQRVRALDISDNVIELMLRKIARLPAGARAAIQVAACIGNTFPLELLGVGLANDQGDPRALLAPAVEEGLVATLNGNARFTHDRIQQAVYETLSPEQAQGIHRVLGQHLLDRRQGRESLLAAVQQLNLGAPLIESGAERLRLAELNLEAGQVAKTTMAYFAARDFFNLGEALAAMCDDADQRVAALRFELHLQQAEIDFCCGEGEQALQRLRQLLTKTHDTLARIRVFEQLIGICTVTFKLAEALTTGTEALSELGVEIPSQRSADAVLSDVAEIERLLAGRTIDDFLESPEMTGERELAVVGLLTHLIPAAYVAGADVFPFLATELVRQVLQGGRSRFAAFGFCVYAMLLALTLRRYEDASTIGRLALEAAERTDTAQRAQVSFFHAAFVMHWSEPLKATLAPLENAWHIGVETGDLQFASYAINHIHGNGLFAGQSLAELEKSVDRFRDTSNLLRQEHAHQVFLLIAACISGLRRPQEDLPDLAAECGGRAMIDIWRESGNAAVLAFYYVLKAQLALLLGKPAEALAAAELALPNLSGVGGMTWVPQHHFVHALALASAVREGRLDRNSARQRIVEYRDQLAELARHGPMNYRSKHLLVEAELADLDGQDHGAVLNAYDAAIDAAAQAMHIPDEALANELASGCWLRRDKQRLAAMYLQQALQSYEFWGAEAKVAQLLRDQAPALISLFPARPADDDSTSSSSGGLHAVDIQSVLKAAQTVAGELVTDRMLARLIALVVETAGAQCGYLLLEQDSTWRVVASQLTESDVAEVMQWRDLGDYPDIAASVVQYVAHTAETVNLDDASKSSVFGTDASISRRGCKSLLCLPIINRGSLGGILYLENNLATHAFTRTHTRVLQLLTAQAISSIEVSRYYARVEVLNQSLKAEIEERKSTESKLDFLAHHDALTNLPNRRLFYDRVQHAIVRAQRSNERVAVLFLDLDQFKTINDSLSHQVGDHLLQVVAERLSWQVRDGDTLGRLGGDEFVLLMEGVSGTHDLTVVANKLLATFHEPFQIDDHDLYPTSSLGISLYPDDASDADQLLRNADAAMYRAKQQGRNTYQFFSADLAVAAAERLALERDLRRAIEHQEFELHYQPQVELTSGLIVGGEALIRWNHPERGLLMPDSFIPVAEETGSIIAIGEWVLEQACRHLELWRREGIEISRLAVNVSGSQFSWHGGFAALVQRALTEFGIEPESLEIELTESVIIQDAKHAMRSLAHLNALGVRLAIDDFGTGYSSLSYLNRLPVHRLKIDRSFVRNLPHAHDDATIVRSIMDLGRHLGKQVIAEGIETEAQRDFLREAGCSEGQGHLFWQAMSAAEFLELLRRQSAG